jgi:hypothetical protein
MNVPLFTAPESSPTSDLDPTLYLAVRTTQQQLEDPLEHLHDRPSKQRLNRDYNKLWHKSDPVESLDYNRVLPLL